MSVRVVVRPFRNENSRETAGRKQHAISLFRIKLRRRVCLSLTTMAALFPEDAPLIVHESWRAAYADPKLRRSLLLANDLDTSMVTFRRATNQAGHGQWLVDGEPASLVLFGQVESSPTHWGTLKLDARGEASRGAVFRPFRC